MNPLYLQVAQRAGHRGEYCCAPEAIFNLPFEVEHIVPSAHGGADDLSDLALSCRACNLFKADRLRIHDTVTDDVVYLFDPRRQGWGEHFEIEADSGRIPGTTPVGRATVATLQMNRPHQLAARQQWIKLGLFP